MASRLIVAGVLTALSIPTAAAADPLHPDERAAATCAIRQARVRDRHDWATVAPYHLALWRQCRRVLTGANLGLHFGRDGGYVRVPASETVRHARLHVVLRESR